MKTVTPIAFEDVTKMPGVTKARIISEIRSSQGIGTRRAVKIIVEVAPNQELVGWVRRELLNHLSVRANQLQPGYHREG